jgi:riboflavin synthase alpha subunit
MAARMVKTAHFNACDFLPGFKIAWRPSSGTCLTFLRVRASSFCCDVALDTATTVTIAARYYQSAVQVLLVSC